MVCLKCQKTETKEMKVFSVKVTGLDSLQRQLQEAQAGLEALNGNIAELHFIPVILKASETPFGKWSVLWMQRPRVTRTIRLFRRWRRR